MNDHTLFITLAYLITFLGCGGLVLATLMRWRKLRKKLKYLCDDQTG